MWPGGQLPDEPWARTSDRRVWRAYRNALVLTVTRLAWQRLAGRGRGPGRRRAVRAEGNPADRPGLGRCPSRGRCPVKAARSRLAAVRARRIITRLFIDRVARRPGAGRGRHAAAAPRAGRRRRYRGLLAREHPGRPGVPAQHQEPTVSAPTEAPGLVPNPDRGRASGTTSARTAPRPAPAASAATAAGRARPARPPRTPPTPTVPSARRPPEPR